MKRKIIFTLIFIFTIFIMMPHINYAHASDPSKGLGCGGGLGPIGELLCPENNPTRETVGIKLNAVVSMIVGFMTTVAGLWFIFQFISAGYQWINSGGDKTALEAARNKIYHSLIGIIIIVAAWVIIALLGTILGLDILNPGQIIQTLGL